VEETTGRGCKRSTAPWCRTARCSAALRPRPSAAVTASRAITEAAQSRLTFIHGAREDLRKETYEHAQVHAELSRFFLALEPDADWADLADATTLEIESDLEVILRTMRADGLERSFRIDMSQPGRPFSVVKVFVPEARLTIPI
jgi:ribosomal protein S12 methylthiotransferase accessory factor